MTTNKTAFAVGLFIIAGIGIAITAIIWLGMSNYFETGQNHVAFFDESVQGLDKDSPVKYRGVSIGRVQSVGVAPDGTLIQVVLTIEDDLKVESDMYAQLKSVGITGIMFIEIDRKKEGDPDYHPQISFYTEYPIIITKPSGVKMFMDSMDAVLDLIHKLDTKGISEKLKMTADKMYQFFEDAQIEEVSSNIRSSIAKVDRMLDVERWERITNAVEKSAEAMRTLTANANATVSNINRTVSDLNRVVSGIEKDLEVVVSEARISVKSADTFLKEGTHLIKSSDNRFSSLQRYLLVTLQNLEKTSESLSNLANLLEDHPSQLIFGESLPPGRSRK